VIRVTIRTSTLPEIAEVRAVAARRPGRLIVVVDANLTPREQKIAALKLMTDDEYQAWNLTFPRQRLAATA